MRCIATGASRTVILVGSWAIKIPGCYYLGFSEGWKAFLRGLLHNLAERAWAGMKHPKFCPVLFAMPGGWFLIMRRARVMTDEEFLSFDVEAFCDCGDFVLPAEHKGDSFGWLDGRPVALDYGD